tara:strand:- start:828 stop:1406 length:579 start_codon:yes stop_codon:yes gene_type:complete
MAEEKKDSDKINKIFKGKVYRSQKELDRAKARLKQDKLNKKIRKGQKKKETKRRTGKIKENLTDEEKKLNRKYPGAVVNKKLKSFEDDAKEKNKKRIDDDPKLKKGLKRLVNEGEKFDYKNKSKTKFSDSRARRASRGRSSSDIAKDPSFMKNTSKGKYLRGLHFALRRQGMATGGAVKKPSTKPSAGNKWN